MKRNMFFLLIIFSNSFCSDSKPVGWFGSLVNALTYPAKKSCELVSDYGRGQQALADIEVFKQTAVESQQSLGKALELSDGLKRIDDGVKSNQDTLEKIARQTKSANDFLIAIRVASDLYNVFRLAQDTRRFVKWLFPTQAQKEAEKLNELRVTNELEMYVSRNELSNCLSQNNRSLSLCKSSLDRYALVADPESVKLIHQISNP